MSVYTPTALTSYPTTANLVALYTADGLRTGFGSYTNALNPTVFSSPTNFFNKCIAEGFFTGSFPLLFYSPASAAGLGAAGIEARMRAEGITTGAFDAGTICHSAGDDTVAILQNLSTEGYITGCPAPMTLTDPALYDTPCADGRCYGPSCVNLWSHQIDSGIIGTASGPGWTASPGAVTFTVTFDVAMTILWVASLTISHARYRFSIDSVIIETTPDSTGDNGTLSAIFNVAAGSHTFTFEYYAQGSPLWPGSASFVGWRQPC